MAKRRRGGRRQPSGVSQVRHSHDKLADKNKFVRGGIQVSELQSDAAAGGSSAAAEGDESNRQDTEKSEPKVLDCLSPSEMSAKYGKGFELLQRMGFKVGALGGLRADSLPAPLRAHNQGRSRKGVQGAEDVPSIIVAPNCGPDTGKSMSALLADVLETMRAEGDDHEAKELKELAACVGLEGSLVSLESSSGVDLQCSSDNEDEDVESSWQPSSRERELAHKVMQSLWSDDNFPVEISEQARRLHWKKLWKAELGDYASFLERWSDLFCIVRCPAPHGALVMPTQVPCEIDACSSPTWSGASKCMKWCNDRHTAASGKAKRKWKHISKTVRRLCHKLVNVAAAPAEEATSAMQSVSREQLTAKPTESNTMERLGKVNEACEEFDDFGPDVSALDWYEDIEGAGSFV